MQRQHTSSSRWLDRLGVCASVGCGLHCAALSVMMVLYPTLWLHKGLRASGLWDALWWAEAGLLSLTWVVALLASWWAWRRDRTLLVPGLALVGLAVLTTTIVSPLHGRSPWISAFALLGGLLVASAHGLNLRRAWSLRNSAA